MHPRTIEENDPRFEWARMIFAAYHDDTEFPLDVYRAHYPADIRRELLAE
jgi:hypothetical protein